MKSVSRISSDDAYLWTHVVTGCNRLCGRQRGERAADQEVCRRQWTMTDKRIGEGVEE